ncbi:hypothetical protein CALCODRAFT_308936 [Calocera cornea HHB12733]|uniref:Uncharacterized protein n=1 Tax=Calocera cornea HHB12733 TaxID=1353952 RepID=A0A165FH08_9BASI|nr:hypothetical protein CALCODRAFT_308936 [Calocera cornea HHB12733]
MAHCGIRTRALVHDNVLGRTCPPTTALCAQRCQLHTFCLCDLYLSYGPHTGLVHCVRLQRPAPLIVFFYPSPHRLLTKSTHVNANLRSGSLCVVSFIALAVQIEYLDASLLHNLSHTTQVASCFIPAWTTAIPLSPCVALRPKRELAACNC